ncbi:hypothetical protein MJC1_01484 [Methylocystis sp. MJC1]|jgi:hypothetical protein|nr:hypothetical protein MJC1_01484 [Methylocystis sp. MJC1]
MKLRFPASQSPARKRSIGLMLLLALALGAASLSLGGCTCADSEGNLIECPFTPT